MSDNHSELPCDTSTASGATLLAESSSAFTGHRVSFGEAFKVWCRVAALSFGGPAGQIAVMHRILVDEKRWVSENRFLHALNYCMLLPGPEAQQLATYIGWLLHGWRGGLVAGGLFILPGFVAILALSLIYAVYQDATLVQALFFGLKAAVLAVVISAVIRIGSKALKNRLMVAIAALAFVGIFFFEVPFPIIVLGAGLLGLIGGRLWPSLFAVLKGHGEDNGPAAALADHAEAHTRPSWGRTLKVLAVWLPLWFVPVAALVAVFGREHVLAAEAIFFSKAAVVTFGGAYSVLAYIAQQAVETYQWLMPGEMLDGLGMAETTPGPLIQIVQFVGFMGAYRFPEPFDPIMAGILGSIVTTWVTFTPCFLWIFLGAPYIEHLRGNKVLSAALSTITAAVVGVVLNLAIWFGVHVMFDRIEEWRGFGVRLLVPEWATINVASLLITAGAFIAMFQFKWGMIRTLAVAAGVGMAWFLLFNGGAGT
ncbi:chromate efflux transporter [Phycisphaerales bacterium AB-hyl4]|uniref:Chromate efflux transporter n=1 Tax=Natronomicrosphaera hydrolytica TaxID=3242702 RepID=A0ABV4U543_9BACT